MKGMSYVISAALMWTEKLYVNTAEYECTSTAGLIL